MTTLETSKPQFTFTQFGATGKWGDERHSQETGDSRGCERGGKGGEQWQNRGVVVARSSSIFLRRLRLWLGLARLGLAWVGLTLVSGRGRGRVQERERQRGSRGSDLGSKMSGWQKCLNAITNLTFHITSKRQSLSQVNSSPSPSQSCERSPTYAPC